MPGHEMRSQRDEMGMMEDQDGVDRRSANRAGPRCVEEFTTAAGRLDVCP